MKQRKSKQGVHSLAVFLAALLVLVAACHKDTEEDKIRKVITAVQKSAEEKKIMSVLAHVSKTYQDQQGNDYDGIKGLLAFYFFRHRKVSVYIPDIDVAVTGPAAKASFQAILTGAGTGDAAAPGILPDTLGAYNFDVHFRKEEAEWRIVSAAWERAGEGIPVPQR